MKELSVCGDRPVKTCTFVVADGLMKQEFVVVHGLVRQEIVAVDGLVRQEFHCVHGMDVLACMVVGFSL